MSEKWEEKYKDIWKLRNKSVKGKGNIKIYGNWEKRVLKGKRNEIKLCNIRKINWIYVLFCYNLFCLILLFKLKHVNPIAKPYKIIKAIYAIKNDM